MANKDRVPVTKEGLERLRAELEELKNVKMPADHRSGRRSSLPWRPARKCGLRRGRHDQMMTQRRIDELEAMLRQFGS